MESKASIGKSIEQHLNVFIEKKNLIKCHSKRYHIYKTLQMF